MDTEVALRVLLEWEVSLSGTDVACEAVKTRARQTLDVLDALLRRAEAAEAIARRLIGDVPGGYEAVLETIKREQPWNPLTSLNLNSPSPL